MKGVVNGSQFSVAVVLVLLVRKGIITREEMNSFYSEVNMVYALNRGNHEDILLTLLGEIEK